MPPRRPEPEGRMGVARRSMRCSSSTMLPHRLLLAPCARHASPMGATPPNSRTGSWTPERCSYRLLICMLLYASMSILPWRKLSWMLLPACVIAALLIASDYQIKQVKVLPIESYPARATVGAVTIAADPYTTDDRSYSAFDIRNLNSRGYFPVHVIIKNASSDFLSLRTRNVVLMTSAGQQLYTTPATIVVEDVVGGAGLAGRIPLVKKGHTDQSTSTKSGSPLSDFTTKELTNRLVDPETVSDGFLFFFTPEPKKNLFPGSTLYIPKLEEEGNKKSVGPFTIPLDPALK
jgi:hypothetical protein